MSPNEAQEVFLRESDVAVLATVDRRGRAHAAPIWYLYEDGEFVMSTGRGSQKHRNIEANPDVTLVIDRRSLPYYYLSARGGAEIGPALSQEDRGRIASRYLTEEQTRRYLERIAGLDSVSIRLKPRKLIEFNGQAGR
ncbi:MAG: TIGR03618 family F420-dependent PPOX class oxidoreductase [Chloroflexi bacterium]|nr:MAG: TIGR03618 family F420-dependent PPOX class oxidoreductase [Chloroflexota bacterium]